MTQYAYKHQHHRGINNSFLCHIEHSLLSQSSTTENTSTPNIIPFSKMPQIPDLLCPIALLNQTVFIEDTPINSQMEMLLMTEQLTGL